jgi:hypothetical protein
MSVLFPDRPAALAELREDRLSGPLFAGQSFSATHLERLLASAEAEVERALRVFLGTVVVLPDDGDQVTRDALDAAGTRWVEDPGYDLEPGFFQGERWGFLVLRHRPVIRVEAIRLVYPQPGAMAFVVPPGWIRVDQRAGHVNLVPLSGAGALPINMYMMQVMGGGRTIPRMIQVRYTAGIANPHRDYPELADLVLQLAAVKTLHALMLPGSGSVSADGLSQSRNVAIADYQGDIDARLDGLRQAIHGVQMICL